MRKRHKRGRGALAGLIAAAMLAAPWAPAIACVLSTPASREPMAVMEHCHRPATPSQAPKKTPRDCCQDLTTSCCLRSADAVAPSAFATAGAPDAMPSQPIVYAQDRLPQPSRSGDFRPLVRPPRPSPSLLNIFRL